jgi:hypothetical protein
VKIEIMDEIAQDIIQAIGGQALRVCEVSPADWQ